MSRKHQGEVHGSSPEPPLPVIPLSLPLSFRNKTVNGDCRRDPRERSRSPIERAAAPAVSLHGGHLYASLPGLMEQPLALTKNSSDTGRSAVERQQVCMLLYQAAWLVLFQR